MEEKERYELVEEDFAYAIVDNEEHKAYQNDCFDFNNICDLLNQQDKRIKELEEENELLKEDLVYEKNFWRENNKTNFVLYKEKEKENQQLKQQLHDLPKKIVGDI